MLDSFATRLAGVLTAYSVPVQPGDFALIMGTTLAQPLIEALATAILARGGHPHVEATLPNLSELLLEHGSDDQLTFVDPTRLTLAERITARFRLIAPYNTRSMAGIDPSRTALLQRAHSPVADIYARRIAAGELRRTVCAWPTQAAAQDAEMSLSAYSAFVYRACGLDQPDPIAHWRAFRERQLALCDWLAGREHCEVRGPGIDLSFSFAGRPWRSSHGELNMPDGELYAGPIEDSVNGTVAFNFPTVYLGRQASGVRLVIKDGEVVDARAGKGEAHLLAQLGVDAGARRVGEFAIGTNLGIQQFTGDTLFDEKIGGTIHVALGRGYTETGSLNASAVHWDMVHDMRQGGTIHIDGELFFEDGRFTV